MVEVGGIEPPSLDRQIKATPCSAYHLRLDPGTPVSRIALAAAFFKAHPAIKGEYSGTKPACALNRAAGLPVRDFVKLVNEDWCHTCKSRHGREHCISCVCVYIVLGLLTRLTLRPRHAARIRRT